MVNRMCEICKARNAVMYFKKKFICGDCANGPYEATPIQRNTNDGNVINGDVSGINYRNLFKDMKGVK